MSNIGVTNSCFHEKNMNPNVTNVSQFHLDMIHNICHEKIFHVLKTEKKSLLVEIIYYIGEIGDSFFFLPSPSASSKFVLSVLKYLGILKTF